MPGGSRHLAGDVDHVAVNRQPRQPLGSSSISLLGRGPSQCSSASAIAASAPSRRRRLAVLSGAGVRRHLTSVEHHLAIWPRRSSFALRGGGGRFGRRLWRLLQRRLGRGRAARSVEGRVYFPHSLGVFYQAMTQYLGFPHYGDEYKVMGLAPYGQPRYLDAMRQIVMLKTTAASSSISLLPPRREKIDDYQGRTAARAARSTPSAGELLGPARDQETPLEQRHGDIARSAQAIYEEAFFHLLKRCTSARRRRGRAGRRLRHQLRGQRQGLERSPFQRSMSSRRPATRAVPSARPSPFGTGGRRKRHFVMDHAYWGPRDADKIASAIDARRADSMPRAAPSSASATKRRFADARRRRSPTAR